MLYDIPTDKVDAENADWAVWTKKIHEEKPEIFGPYDEALVEEERIKRLMPGFYSGGLNMNHTLARMGFKVPHEFVLSDDYRDHADRYVDGKLDFDFIRRVVSLPARYGVCDTPKQLLQWIEANAPFVLTGPQKYVVAMTLMRKEDQSADGGWRWHKWGQYIGTQTPTMEYLYDEPDITEVWVYSIIHVYFNDEPTLAEIAKSDTKQRLRHLRWLLKRRRRYLRSMVKLHRAKLGVKRLPADVFREWAKRV